MKWHLTPHAKSRIEEMGITKREVAETLLDPDLEYPGSIDHPPGRRVKVRNRLAVVVEPATAQVISVLWNRAEGRDHQGQPLDKQASEA